MKKILTAFTLALFVTACAQTDASQSGWMMSGDMMKNCQEMMNKGMAQDGMMPCCQKMMRDGMMKDGMSGDMMKQCQMMQQSGMDKQPAAAPTAPPGVSPEDHKKHHPAQ